jgi:hypothetical protein
MSELSPGDPGEMTASQAAPLHLPAGSYDQIELVFQWLSPDEAKPAELISGYKSARVAPESESAVVETSVGDRATVVEIGRHGDRATEIGRRRSGDRIHIPHDTLQCGDAATWETVTRDSQTAYIVRLKPCVKIGLLTTS